MLSLGKYKKSAEFQNKFQERLKTKCKCFKSTIHYSRATAKQGRDDEKTAYSEQCIKGVCHVSRTGFLLCAVRRICVEVVVSSTTTKYFFVEKKSSAAQKLTVNNEQCTATRSSRFHQQYFIRPKNNFVPYSSCSRIVFSGLQNYKMSTNQKSPKSSF